MQNKIENIVRLATKDRDPVFQTLAKSDFTEIYCLFKDIINQTIS